MDSLPKRRIVLLDEIRGFAIICMVVYHFCYDLIHAQMLSIPFFDSGPMNFIRDVFAGLFMFISGISCLLSRNNLRRGVLCMGAALLVTGVSALSTPEMPIRFGILHLLGTCMILYGVLEPVLRKTKPLWGVILCALLFLFTWGAREGFMGIPVLLEIPIPNIFYQTEVFFPFGILAEGFVSGDYFPLFPWMFCFFAGSFFALWCRSRKIPEWAFKTHVPFFALAGKYTLWIYLLHQPVLFVILKLIQVIRP